MTPERWQSIKSILADALEHEDPSARSTFIAQACADDAALRREVDSFLAQDAERLEKFASGSDSSADHDAANTNTGRRLGAYELVRELGRGGMGTVWLARRADERFEQEVAVKLLKRGTDTEEVLSRFRAERRIVGRLEHPGIARLFDAGESDDGLPYFVMEYVAGGESLTHFAEERALSIPARLELFRKVCAAVQFAHQNLIVHRDLKPGNILVTADGEPKLLDFGIARLLEPGDDGTAAALAETAADHRRLTPAYASPEQVRGEPITTASDIYALGAVLYELLTRESPHRFARERPTPAELMRVIAEGEPRRPSLAAANDETRRRLRGDLDNIVLRALAREPARRYANASGLGDDLQRHLSGRPVRARADTLRYRMAKFVGRNKVAVTAGALLAVALVFGIAATAWQAHRAERRFAEVRGLTNSVLFEIHDAIRDLPGSTAARQIIVNRALEYLDRLAREAGGDSALQLELADAYLRVGDVQGKPYTANLGDSAGALRSYTEAIEIATPLVGAGGVDPSKARRIESEAYESLGGVQSRLRRWEDATDSHRRALALRTTLLQTDPEHAEKWQRGIVADYIGLGDAVVNANRFQPAPGYQQVALDHYRRALPIGETLVANHPKSEADAHWLAKTCSRIATVLSEMGAADDPEAFREATPLHPRSSAG